MFRWNTIVSIPACFETIVFQPNIEQARVLDVPLEYNRLDPGLFPPFRDGVAEGERLCEAALPLRRFQGPPRGACEVEGLPQLPGRLRLLGPFHEVPRERRIGRVLGRCSEVLPGRL